MAGPWTGREGALYLSTTEVGYTDSWSLSVDKEEIEISKLNATAKEYLSGLTSATLSASGHITDDASLLTLINQFMQVDPDGDGSSVSAVAAATLTFKLYTKKAGASASSYYVSLSATATGLELSTDPGSPAKWSFNGRVTGDATWNVFLES